MSQKTLSTRLIVSFLVFTLSYAITNMLRALNSIQANYLANGLNIDSSTLGLATAFFLLAYAVAQLPLGILLDKYDIRAVLSGFALIAAIGLLIFSFATDSVLLGLARFLIGFGSSAGLMVAFKLNALWFKKNVALLNGITIASGGIGSALATLPAKYLLDLFGWRNFNLTLAFIVFATAVITYLIIPQTKKSHEESKGNSIKGLLSILTDRNFIRIIPIATMIFGSFMAFTTFWTAVWLTDIAKYSNEQMAVCLLGLSIAIIVGSFSIGAIGNYCTKRQIPLERVILTLSILAIIIQLVLILTTGQNQYVLWFLYGVLMRGVTLIPAYLANSFPVEKVGRAVTLQNFFVFIMGFVFQGAMGFLVAALNSSNNAFVADNSFRIVFMAVVALELASVIWMAVFTGRKIVAQEMRIPDDRASFHVEKGNNGTGIQIVRTVIDTLRDCNSHCKYCYFYHSDFGKKGDYLPAEKIKEVLIAADRQGQLDIVLSGGEITLHPEWKQIMDATHSVKNAGITMITNGILLNPEKVDDIRRSNISRVCVSFDGAVPEMHDYARGKNFEKVVAALRLLKKSGKNISALTTLHQKNIDSANEISDFLLAEGLADQHHFACLYHSGNTKLNWRELMISADQLQKFIDRYDATNAYYLDKGLFRLFNHYWQLTGKRSPNGNHRLFLSHQLGEQNKATWAVVRFNGDVNSTITYWGRESASNPVVGNLFNEKAETLFGKLEQMYSKDNLMQLERSFESSRKYVIGEIFDKNGADQLISPSSEKVDEILTPCIPMSEMDVMNKPVNPEVLDSIIANSKSGTVKYRHVYHRTGVFLVHDNSTAQSVVLSRDEYAQLVNHLAQI